MKLSKKTIGITALAVVTIGASLLIFKPSQESDIESEIEVEESLDIAENLYEDTFSNEYTESEENVEDYEESTIGENITDENTQENKNTQEDNVEDKEVNSTVKTSSGIFQGFADGNFIEVKIGGSYQVFKLSSDVKSKVQSKQIGDVISFTYISSGGQQLITSVE